MAYYDCESEMEVRGIENNLPLSKGLDRSSMKLKDLAKAKIKRGRIGQRTTGKQRKLTFSSLSVW